MRDVKNILLGTVLAALVLVIVGSLVWYTTTRPEPPDADTLCPAKGPLGHFVLLVDRTDPLNEIQRRAFAVLLREIVEQRTPEGYLLSVFALGEDFRSNADPLVELCNPGTGAGRSELTANLKWLRRNYEDKFRAKVLEEAERQVSNAPERASPVFEMLQLVGINGFRRHSVAGERRLIVISDMLHHSGQFSLFRGVPDFAAFAATDYGKRALADLRGVDVELHYVIHAPGAQTMRNLSFWEQYFDKSGARLREVRPLEGLR